MRTWAAAAAAAAAGGEPTDPAADRELRATGSRRPSSDH